MNKLRPYEITSLPPGFIVITYDRDSMDSIKIRLGAKEWAELKRKGYSGGVIIPEGVKIESLDEKLMADLGWVPAPRV